MDGEGWGWVRSAGEPQSPRGGPAAPQGKGTALEAEGGLHGHHTWLPLVVSRINLRTPAERHPLAYPSFSPTPSFSLHGGDRGHLLSDVVEVDGPVSPGPCAPAHPEGTGGGTTSSRENVA